MDADKVGGSDVKGPGGAGELERGSSVGRYLILGVIGKGGMGEVYAAYDPELDRKIALKLLRANISQGGDPSEGRARLLREAQAIARLSDPNVVVVFDVGMFVDRVFLAMEFIDGNTLAYWSQAKSRTWREVVEVFQAAGRGLASAHRAGVVHRDFKPDNVMISLDGQIRVMDFGLARTIEVDADKIAAAEERRTGMTPTGMTPTQGINATGARVSTPRPVTPATGKSARGSAAADVVTPQQGTAEHPTGFLPFERPKSSLLAGIDPSIPITSAGRGLPASEDTPTRDLSRAAAGLRADSPGATLNAPLTLSGAMMGTPAYMAPEQFQGAAIDARTDQFSFCVAVYEALYGQRPFAGRNIQDLTVNVLAGKVRDAPAQARVPGWLRKVILRGLRTDRDQRHPSMEALLAEMGRDPARKRTRRLLSASAVAVIAILGVGLFRAQRQQRMRCLGGDAKLAGIWELPSAKGLSPRKQGIQRAFMATGKRYAADSFTVVANALDRYVTDWNNMHRDSCEATHMRGEQSSEVLDLRTSCLQDRFAELRALTNVFSNANGDVVSGAVGATHALQRVEQCGDIATLRAVVRPPDDPAVRSAVADVRSQLAEVKAQAIAGKYKQVSDRIQEVVESARRTKYPPVIAESLLRLAEIQIKSGDGSRAEASYEQAVWLADGSRHDEVVAEASAELIYAAGYLRGHFADGERWARQATAALHRLGTGHDVIAGWRANNLGVMYEKEGRLEDSLAANLEAVALKSRALGGAHFDVGISYGNVALALFRLGRVDEAIQRNQQALKILRGALGPVHPQVGIALLNEADLLNSKGRYREARDAANQAISIWERESGSDHPLLAYGLTSIGESFVDEGQPSLAIPYLERAIRIRETKDPEAELLAQTRFALARALWDSKGALDRAMSLAERARADYQANRLAQKKSAEVDGWINGRSDHIRRATP